MKTENMIASIIERKHTERLLIEKNKRLDGRGLVEFRPFYVKTGTLKKAEGSAKVRIGNTIVYAGVKADLGSPFPDTPNEGVLIVNIELSPIASPYFESGPPTKESIELARVVDRTIRESKVIDVEKLCVKAGEKVWIVFVDIYILADDGNLIDASTLAAMAALYNAKVPVMKEDPENEGNWIKTEESMPIPLKMWATSCTFAKIGKKIILDPILEEEKIEDARFTVGINEEKKVTALQKGHAGTFSASEILEMVDIALEKGPERIAMLKDILSSPSGGNMPEDEF